MAEITHFSHEHPLILRKKIPKVNVDGYGHLCYFCDPVSSREEVENEGDHVDVYVCELCKKFFLHKSCAELPREIIYSSHERHSLVLSKKSTDQRIKCKYCSSNIINNVFYNCDLCEFHLHIRCAFMFKNSVMHYDDKDRILIHASHKEHSLCLFPRPATVLCDACDLEKDDFFYHCLSCRYQMHRRCAFLPSTTNLKDHPHPVSLSFTLPPQYHYFNDFYCDICEQKLDKTQKNWLFYCQLCRYFVHVNCMEKQPYRNDTNLVPYDEGDIIYLPTADKSMDLFNRSFLGDKEFVDIPQEIQIFSHKQHPLVLSHEQITEDVIEDDEEILCDGCIEPISSPPYYHCAQCRYFLHLPCANFPSKLQHPIKLNPPHQIQFNEHREHPLILSHEHIAEDIGEILCTRCSKPISSRPYYRCVQCQYCTHLHCVYTFIKYPEIPCPLTLGSKSRFYEGFRCNKCFHSSNGFFFYNQVDDNIKFHLDVKCAALLSLRTVVIKHESHSHPLIPEYAFKSIYGIRDEIRDKIHKCMGCNGSTSDLDFTFTCQSCIFNLHYECLMLPKTTRHRYDSNHPLILKFPPHTYHEKPFDCAACEKEIHPRFWLYHCEECDLSFHIKCINPQLGKFKFGQILKLTSHSHPLKFVMEAAVKSPCHNCGNDIDLDFVFECETCNFHLCRKCVQNIELMS